MCDPLKKVRRLILVYTHPSISDRIDRLQPYVMKTLKFTFDVAFYDNQKKFSCNRFDINILKTRQKSWYNDKEILKKSDDDCYFRNKEKC